MDKFIAILLLVLAVIGLVWYIRRESRKDCRNGCKDCALKDTCSKK